MVVVLENLSFPFARRMWQECVALKKSGYRVVAICPRGYDRSSFERVEEIPIYRYPPLFMARSPAAYIVEYGWALLCISLCTWWVFLRHGFSVIHQGNPPDFLFLAFIPFRLFGVRYVFEHLDLSPEMYEANFRRPKRWIRWLLTALERRSFRSADMVISANESFRQLAIGRGGVPASRVVIVRTAPDLARFTPSEPNDAHRAGRKFLVAYLGVMGLHDGVDLLLRSIRVIHRDWKRNDIFFVLVGGGELLPSFERMAAEFEIGAVTRFTGRIPDHLVCEILSSADLCAAPDPVNSMNTRSTMCKVLEYMAMGKPIVSYDLLESRVSADSAAVYAVDNDPEDFAKKILMVLSDPELGRQMGRIGRERISTTLSWENSSKALQSVYDHLESRSRVDAAVENKK